MEEACKDRSFEPMEIDLSNNSVKSMDISYNESNVKVKEEVIDPGYVDFSIKKEVAHQVEHRPVRKYRINKKKVTMNQPVHYKLRYKLILPAIIVAVCSMLIYYSIDFKCCVIDIDVIEERLSNSLFGQSDATSEIVSSLRSDGKSKMLFFYGGTGVGKTFAVSLILEGLWGYSNMFHYTMPSFKSTLHENIMLGMALCDNSIIVIDDLSIYDMSIKDEVKFLVQKSQDLGKNLTLILVYNCDTITKDFARNCDETFVDDLKQTYMDVESVKKFFKFNHLREEDLKMCIKHELGHKHISDDELETLASAFDVKQDGCKGVYTKMKLLNLS